ncbi:MAG: hypothetical protein ACK4N5_21275, partial [Myxococcales bacterium]
MAGHLFNPPQPPREIVPEVPEAYEQIILKCLAKNPADRWASMDELGAAIHDCATSLGISLELPPADAADGRPRSGAAGMRTMGPSRPTVTSATNTPAAGTLHAEPTVMRPAGGTQMPTTAGTPSAMAAAAGTIAASAPQGSK